MADNSHSPSQCFVVLELSGVVDEVKIGQAYRRLAKSVHPDAGGSCERMVELNNARDEALELLRWNREHPQPAPRPQTSQTQPSAGSDGAAAPSYDEEFVDDALWGFGQQQPRPAGAGRAAPPSANPWVPTKAPFWSRLAWHLLRNTATFVCVLLVGLFGMYTSHGNSPWLTKVAHQLPGGWVDVSRPWWTDSSTTTAMAAGMVAVALVLALVGPSRTAETKVARVLLAVPVMALVTWNAWMGAVVAACIVFAWFRGDE
ncbi:MAG: hypothetical protein RLZ55_1607 [Actinomycetota bacterium]|jgi:hypothetical protein